MPTPDWSGARAAESLPEPARGARGPISTVNEVIDGDTLVLGNGMEVRLVGIQVPKLPLGRPGFPTWPLADTAKRTLETLSAGRRLTLHYGGRRTDRHGRQLAHLFDSSGIWLQGELLARGIARVYSFADNRSLVAEMPAIKRSARVRKLGIWTIPSTACAATSKPPT